MISIKIKSQKLIVKKISALNEPTPVSIKHELSLICPYISVKIPFWPDLHGDSTKSRPKSANQKLLAALHLVALNGAKKALKSLKIG